jgi:DNA-binding Xre family transcriptional regulator
MRLRIDELLRRRGLTAYALSKASKGRISLPMAYRLLRRRGRFNSIKSDVLDALCEVFEVNPGDLFES